MLKEYASRLSGASPLVRRLPLKVSQSCVSRQIRCRIHNRQVVLLDRKLGTLRAMPGTPALALDVGTPRVLSLDVGTPRAMPGTPALALDVGTPRVLSLDVGTPRAMPGTPA